MRRPRLSGPRRAVPARRARAVRATTVAVGVLAAAALSACDASPYAASVNGSTIKQAALNTELRWATIASDFTTTLVGNYNSLNNVALAVHGDSSNTYSTEWTAYTLSQIVQGRLVRQAVAARGGAPSSDLYSAALGGIEIESGGVTGPKGNGGVTQMTPSYLVNLTQRLADHAYLETPASLSALQGFYTHYLANFYSQVCVTQASVSVQGANGGVDYTQSQTQAATVAQRMANAGPNASGVGGASSCYTHEQLDAQAPSFINTVVALAPSHASIQKTNYGYQVIDVSSRANLPLAGPVAQLLTTLVYDLQSPGSDTVLLRLEAKANVRVNPAYGTWRPPTSAAPAQVVAPAASPTTPVGSSGALASSLGATLGS